MPLVPIEYETAINALQACTTMDESKLWSDKADALAAWAKIYRDHTIERKSKQLKLHAYRRMGQIAAEIRPQERMRRSDGKIMGKKDGPASLLREQGVNGGREFAATRLARLDDVEFQGLIDRPRIPSPMAVLRIHAAGGIDMGQLINSASSFRTACRKLPAEVAARALAEASTNAQHNLFIELLEWLDRFDQSFRGSSPPQEGNDHGK